MARGTRPYNEDAFQAGVIEIPAFAKRLPRSWARSPTKLLHEGEGAESSYGDPQVFYFGVFDGHGGAECSDWLRKGLHTYIESATRQFELESSLKDPIPKPPHVREAEARRKRPKDPELDDWISDIIKRAASTQLFKFKPLRSQTKEQEDEDESSEYTEDHELTSILSEPAVPQPVNDLKAEDLEAELVALWRKQIGGYFRRFKPDHLSLSSGGLGHLVEREASQRAAAKGEVPKPKDDEIGMETVLAYSFLKADLDFVTAVKEASATVRNPEYDSDRPLNETEILGEPSRDLRPASSSDSGAPKGGSTCSISLISTPTPAPFWHPATPATLMTSHVGDTRIILCRTSDGRPVVLTTNHHPSTPIESRRLRRFAGSMVTDSFGEERIEGLANTRSFGDTPSKPLGVSAEPEIKRVELGPAEYSFMVMASDGVSGCVSDREIVDIVKEAGTPEAAAREVVRYANDVSLDGDNATCLVVRMGGWERRQEGGGGSLGSREERLWRREEASDPRRGGAAGR